MTSATTNEASLNRADEVEDLLNTIQDLLIPFIRAADDDADTKSISHSLQIAGGKRTTALIEQYPPKKLERILSQELQIEQSHAEMGKGKEGLVTLVKSILRYSLNTWHHGFLEKLSQSTNAVGVVSELVLAVLNTNVHIYQCSPVLTLIEKRTTKYLASLFGLPSSTSGGISQPGGSTSNTTAIVIARNTLFPSTKQNGNGIHRFTIFTSTHGHYSVEKAANLLGLGSRNVILVPVDERGCMIPSELEKCVQESRDRGETPFFLNATAGTTVQGAFDPFIALSAICKAHNLWLHIDGSWGGSVVFNKEYRSSRLAGAQFADSITINPHKMLGTPLACSFLLGRDMNTFHKALTLPAGYLFHNDTGVDAQDVYDLADLTPQCGRRADSLKLFMALQYYGARHFSDLVARAYGHAEYLLQKLKKSGDFATISPEPLPCLQVCFYYAKGGTLPGNADMNSKTTTEIAQRLISRGFMIDYAPGDAGKFFRVVVNGGMHTSTLDGLVKALEETGADLGY